MSYRLRLALLALALLPLSAPVIAAPPAAQTPEITPAVCPAEAPAPLELARIIPPDFLLCTCANCRTYPDQDCQISPDGYSIACVDWLRLHCVK